MLILFLKKCIYNPGEYLISQDSECINKINSNISNKKYFLILNVTIQRTKTLIFIWEIKEMRPKSYVARHDKIINQKFPMSRWNLENFYAT